MPRAIRARVLLAAAAAASTAAAAATGPGKLPAQPFLAARAKPIIAQAGLRFRDLDGNGRLDPYEDWRLPPRVRAQDLLGRMTLEEKAALLAHGTAPNPGGFAPGADHYDMAAAGKLIAAGVASLITRISAAPAAFAEQNNALQALAERTRLGIPLIIGSDPRSHFHSTFGASSSAGAFSQWPETLGLAAIDDAALTRTFADIVRREYRAVGIHESLAPQADLATEPRWSRIDGTFGEDPAIVSRQVAAYVRGMQGSARGLDRAGVIVVVKHWLGYGAEVDGFDAHNWYGQTARLTDRSLALHEQPFRAAFAAGAAGVMPTYAILQGPTHKGAPLPSVGAGFSKALITGRLRGSAGFRGFVLSDWGIVNDCPAACRGDWQPGRPPAIGMPWGMEQATVEQRIAAALNAGVDQIGGLDEPEHIAAVVRAGAVSRARLDEAALRLLLPRFQLGLFENPYVDPARAAQVVGSAAFQRLADGAQRRAIVELTRRSGFAPRPGQTVYLSGLDATAAHRAGFAVTARLDQADFAVVRIKAPYQRLHPNFFFGAMQHEGDLDYKPGDPDLAAVEAASARVPTVVAVELDRPAILSPLRDRASLLLATFGASDAAVLDIVAGRATAQGRLPLELPSSMAAVRRQRSDLPHDSAAPLFPIHAGKGTR